MSSSTGKGSTATPVIKKKVKSPLKDVETKSRASKTTAATPKPKIKATVDQQFFTQPGVRAQFHVDRGEHRVNNEQAPKLQQLMEQISALRDAQKQDREQNQTQQEETSKQHTAHKHELQLQTQRMEKEISQLKTGQLTTAEEEQIKSITQHQTMDPIIKAMLTDNVRRGARDRLDSTRRQHADDKRDTDMRNLASAVTNIHQQINH